MSGGNLNQHDSVKLNEEGASRAILLDNIIRQNGLSGISLDGGYFEVKGNRIFCNWQWGIMVKSRSCSHILNNDIFENNCGGIRIGHNYTAGVFIDGNTIRDHTGPGIYTVNSITNLLEKVGKPYHVPVGDGENAGESRNPFITSTNVLNNNERGIQHPTEIFCLIEACCFCRKISKQLKCCSRCKNAKYCSRDCQKKHWIKHIHTCKLLNESYVVEVQMCDTEPNNLEGPKARPGEYIVNCRSFSPKLVGIREGTPPDKSSSTRFIVKFSPEREYGYYDPNKSL
ncbi:unnamed protein product [Mytilus edulis]|uniref:MYND-type domain-containing protein n=1 Tax=Mytilus edulis TaxID=6550 RepID=A0A8S3QPD1_MYTED|nr:unnamed protein product [Mytilus edulis]